MNFLINVLDYCHLEVNPIGHLFSTTRRLNETVRIVFESLLAHGPSLSSCAGTPSAWGLNFSFMLQIYTTSQFRFNQVLQVA